MNRDREPGEVIHVDSAAATPIYRQIMESIQKNIAGGYLSVDSPIPSVNIVAERFSIARGSVFKAYNELKSRGIIHSIPGKGYFVKSIVSITKKNIFLLMSTFNPYREEFYNAFINKTQKKATVDLYFHHHNINVFETLIDHHASNYNIFVIMPEIHKKTKNILKKLDQQNLYIVDSGLQSFQKLYPFVGQNYSNDIYAFLKSVLPKLQRFKRTILLFSANMRNYELIKGFERFFSEYPLKGMVIHNTEKYCPAVDDCCIILDDSDLVRLILLARDKRWRLGSDFGIVSYNDTPLKSIIGQGITTISPDYRQMGLSLADMIMSGQRGCILNPFLVYERGSF